MENENDRIIKLLDFSLAMMKKREKRKEKKKK